MIERPNWSIVDYLELLVSIEGLPEAERQAAIEKFFETHPTANVGIRAHLSDENYPDAPTASTNSLRFSDRVNTERLRVGLDDTSEPSIELRDTSGNLTYRISPP
jgi:hypothetical protein